MTSDDIKISGLLCVYFDQYDVEILSLPPLGGCLTPPNKLAIKIYSMRFSIKDRECASKMDQKGFWRFIFYFTFHSKISLYQISSIELCLTQQ